MLPGPRNQRTFKITVDGQQVEIPLSDSLYTNWQNQFQQVGGKNSEARNKTLRAMLKEAYRQGRRDAGR